MSITKTCTRGIIMAIAGLSLSAWAAESTSSAVTIERFAAERGDANAQYFMGEHHELGDSGVSKDLRSALNWYRKAADQGHASAQYKVGLFYERGLGGLTVQPEQALRWYKKAADNGSNVAHRRLSEMDNSKRESEARRQEQQRKAEQEQREQQRKAELEKRRKLEQRQAAKPVVPPLPAPKVAKKEASPKLTGSELLKHVIGTDWHAGAGPAEFLPTKDLSCLKTSDTEITCFSKERKRVIGNKEITFSLKSVINNFSDNATFDVAYTYHVNDIGGSSGSGPKQDDHGLLPKEGWQSTISAKCRLKEPGHTECVSGAKTREYRSR